MKKNVVKFPLHNSLGFHTLGTDGDEKSDVSQCAQSFIEYVQNIGQPLDKQISKNVHEKILQFVTVDKYLKQIIQCVNLGLTIEDVGDIFPNFLQQNFTSQRNPDEKLTGRELYNEIYQMINQ